MSECKRVHVLVRFVVKTAVVHEATDASSLRKGSSALSLCLGLGLDIPCRRMGLSPELFRQMLPQYKCWMYQSQSGHPLRTILVDYPLLFLDR